MPSDSEDLANRAGPADRGDSLASLALGISTDFVSARVSFAVRGRLIGIPGPVDLDHLPVGAVAEAVHGASEGIGTIQKLTELGGSGSRRDRGRPRKTSTSSPVF